MERNAELGRNGARRRSRPMSRTQELIVLTVIFAVGVAVQAAYLFNTSVSP